MTDVLVTALFALATIVQLDDPDPLRWTALYGAACVLSLTVALRRPAWRPSFAITGMAALVWASIIFYSGPGPGVYGRMFDAWEMKSTDVEEAREATGLVIVAAWMGVLYVRCAHRPGRFN